MRKQRFECDANRATASAPIDALRDCALFSRRFPPAATVRAQ
jgi:hypothetical protein